ncbi:MAG: ABC transporter ATP-binding protein [Bacteroidetes bacterium]|nr:MAG: ABC transporter ATP-binding protein [Bacteroidota bacterium]
MSYIIETNQLSKKFNIGKKNEIEVLKNINIKIKNNTTTLLKGASGSGKTTFLSILGGLMKASEGEYICLGKKISHWSEKFLTDFRRQNIGIIFQQFHLVQGLDVWTNIAMPAIPTEKSNQKLKEKVEKIAKEIQIEHKLYEKIDTLSGGEMQRVAIARALLNEPKIVLADEPTSQLDSENSENILQIFQKLKEKGTTIILTSHDSRVENNVLVDEIIQMKDGKII